jgi:hypothetical protein
MVKNRCERRGKEFSHNRRENNADKIKELVDKAVEEKLKKLNIEPKNNKLKVLDVFCGCGGLQDAELNVIDIWDKHNFNPKVFIMENAIGILSLILLVRVHFLQLLLHK